MNFFYWVRLLSGPITAFLIILLGEDGTASLPVRMAAITAWMALWWLTEVVHLAVTSLLPFLLIPTFGIADITIISNEYMDPIMFLFIGGFILAIGIEHWNLHRRLALRILMAVGKTPASILAGVMGVSFFFSMWISNTATTLMMLAAVTAVVQQMEQQAGRSLNKLAAGLLIGLAYSATIGGMSTLVGTPPNMVFYRFYEKAYPDATDMDFTHWFLIGFPIALVFLLAAYWILRWMFIPKGENHAFNVDFFRSEYKKLGPLSFEEKTVAWIFSITVLLWFTRSDINFGSFTFSGWKNLFPYPQNIQDGTVAIAMAMLLFFIPSKNQKGKMLIGWEEAKRLPFHIILLFGSGFALAKGFETSGLSTLLADQLQVLKGANPFLIVISICVIVTVISEFASNVASIQLTLPVLLVLTQTLDVHPLLLMVPATLAASLGFMLPVATGPNTIVFGSNRIRVADMMKAGLILDVIGVLLITAAVMLWK